MTIGLGEGEYARKEIVPSYLFSSLSKCQENII